MKQKRGQKSALKGGERGWLIAVFKGIICGVSFLGCQQPSEPTESAKQFVAIAFEHVLPLQEICDHIPNNAEAADSTLMAERYVDQWIREQVVVHEAENRLPQDLQTFEREIQAYRNALLLHHYKERYVLQRMQQEVPEEEALAYYMEHQDLFILMDYAVRATFLHLPSEDDQDLNFIKSALMAPDTTPSFLLQQWCVEHAAVHSLNTETWWYLEDLIQEVPIELYRTEKQLTNRKLITFDADGRNYFIRFHEHAFIDGVSPFEVVKDRVSELILHGKKQALLIQLEEDLLIQAWEQGNVQKLILD
ncbi:MAG: hypothetical protein OSA78_03580 [Flavobacteriales bacterium]|nr:hypothetical protein [Flavobacteriales bacterium]